jgi:glutathione S-transferase
LVQLVDSDIKTREVLGWKGVHIFHDPLSPPSQKLRIFLSLKKIDWQSHVVDLSASENYRAWFLGINPRGFVPVLVHDGAVHIESNDIILYLEKMFPEPRLIPAGTENEVATLLERENEMRFSLQVLRYRFLLMPQGPPYKPADALKSYAYIVQGVGDPVRAQHLAIWGRFNKYGVNGWVFSATRTIQKELVAVERRKKKKPYLLGKTMGVVDIAWFTHIHWLLLCGFPLAKRYPKLLPWFAELEKRPEFAKEVALPPSLKERFDATRRVDLETEKSLEFAAGFEIPSHLRLSPDGTIPWYSRDRPRSLDS